jgi:hypothetical protein
MAVSEVELKRPLHGGFGIETAKNLTAIYLTDIPQRTYIIISARSGVTAM